LSQKQPAIKQTLSVVIDSLTVITYHLEKNYIVFLITTVATDSYIHCNGINHLRTKVIQNLPENSPFITIIMDLTSVTTDVIEIISNCSQYTTITTDLTSVATDNIT
jgi:hypothetical protein